MAHWKSGLPGHADARIDDVAALALAEADDLAHLMRVAGDLRDAGHGQVVTYSPKVFIPLTRLCRNVCAYCTFVQPGRRQERAYLTPDEVLGIARAGRAAGCREALFTLGDKPELRYARARDELAALGFPTTIAYLAHVSALVLKETGLLPHANPGVTGDDEIAALRRVSVSQGLMLESTSPRLCEKGGVHYGSPDKEPGARLASIEAAGRQRVPFTTGLLIGIGETRRERITDLLALRALHERHGHIQEIIIQNFRAKPDTRMARTPDAGLADHLWTIAVARIVFGRSMHLQAPPNLQAGALGSLIEAGIDDWGGVSPVTPDHVNPEAPWPEIEALARETAACGKTLVPRLTAYPEYVQAAEIWLDEAVRPAMLELSDGSGHAREDSWRTGRGRAPLRHAPPAASQAPRPDEIGQVVTRARDGHLLAESEIAALLMARGQAAERVLAAADALRREASGDVVRYVVNRNINYTNICAYHCSFCAFSKGKTAEALRGAPYDLDLGEIARRVREAWTRGATEVCMQGGIHPRYTGETYLSILRAVREASPGMHIHAFSPLEVWQGAQTLGLDLPEYLAALKQAGLGTLPGTAAEILDDEVRRIICPDKLTTDLWLAIVRAAHEAGFRTTATIMFGHVERPAHVARHLIRVRDLQRETGGFTEFVPLPFVAQEAPIYLKRKARPGPTWREAILMHAVARLALNPWITNIQASWVKMGPDGVKAALTAGANDLGGTLMNESITRAAGAEHGQEMPPAAINALIESLGRAPRIRTTLYADAPPERVAAALAAEPLAPLANTHPSKRVERRQPSAAQPSAAQANP